jgi:hypothetical protein
LNTPPLLDELLLDELLLELEELDDELLDELELDDELLELEELLQVPTTVHSSPEPAGPLLVSGLLPCVQ